jgi:hypothetical protein
LISTLQHLAFDNNRHGSHLLLETKLGILLKSISNALLLASLTAATPFALSEQGQLSPNLTEIKVVQAKNKADAQFNEARNVVSQILETHRCLKKIKNDYNSQTGSLRALNTFIVPGLDAAKMSIGGGSQDDYAPAFKFQYASPLKCVGIRQIDTITPVAKNVFSFRVVYLAEDSGETANFIYKMQKQDSGDWRLFAISSLSYFF